MSVKASNNPYASEPVVFANANAIISLGTITRDGNEFTFSVGFIWKINGVTFQNTAPIVLTIAEASLGFNRIDNALLNTSNTIELQQGNESDTIALRPVAPNTAVILTSWNISGNEIEDSQDPTTGTRSKNKAESSKFTYQLNGIKSVIQLRPEGYAYYSISGNSLTIDGFGLNLITGNLDAEAPYPMKDLFIENAGNHSITLLHDGPGLASSKFFFLDESDLIIPPGGKVWLKYNTAYCQLFLTSWTPEKIHEIIKLQVTSNPNPTDGDLWLESNSTEGLKFRIKGITRTVNLS